MIYLQPANSVGQAADVLNVGIREIETFEQGGRSFVLTTSGRGGGMQSWELLPDGDLVLVDDIVFAPSVSNVAGDNLDLLNVDGQLVAIVGTDPSAGAVGFMVASDGKIAQAETYADLKAAQSAELLASDTGFVFTASAALGQIGCFKSNGQGEFVAGQFTGDSADSHVVAPVSLGEVQVGQSRYLLSLCGQERGVTTFEINASTGDLSVCDTLGEDNGLGILAAPIALRTAELDGASYAIVASSADGGFTGALTVLRVDEGGELVATDHVLDTLNSRFGKPQALAVASDENWVFVLAGGGDDGLSLFTLMPGGQLLHVHSLSSAAAPGLADISAMHVAVVGDSVRVLVASETRPGMTELVFPLDALGEVITAGDAGQLVSGTSLSDMIIGGKGDDQLTGAEGDDTLRGGAGSDTLAGGGGSDLFFLETDGETDTITDFRKGVDRLDLSGLHMLYDATDLQIESTSEGARIIWRDEVTEIISHDGQSLDRNEILNAARIEINRPPLVLEDSGSSGGGEGPFVLQGEAGDDILSGGSYGDTIAGGDGNDTIEGKDGADSLKGGDGDDRIAGGGGNDTIEGGKNNDFIEGGEGDDELLGGNGKDNLSGGDGNDTIDAGSQDDFVDAGAGNDLVQVGAGRDVVFLGDGHDTFLDHAQSGDTGMDTVYGGSGDDRFEGAVSGDWYLGEEGNDVLLGRNGDDTLEGGDGQDKIKGGTGDDSLIGGTDDDVISGGKGIDFGDGGTGDDVLKGGSGNDTLLGGDGADVIKAGTDEDYLLGGSGNDRILAGKGKDILLGGDGDDTLLGEAGADTITGGLGADLFVFQSTHGKNVITDFEPGLDMLQLDLGVASLAEIKVKQKDTGVFLGWEDGSVLLEGQSLSNFSESDVILI